MESTASLAAFDTLSDEERATLLTTDGLLRLLDVFQTIPDPRSCHGRPAGTGTPLEERRLRVTTELVSHLTFPGVQQAMEIRRRVRTKTEEREETWYYLTDCTPDQANPDALLRLIHGHWSIECHHWKRDVIFGEDRSQIRTQSAPQFLAALRNALLTLLCRAGHTAIAATRPPSLPVDPIMHEPCGESCARLTLTNLCDTLTKRSGLTVLTSATPAPDARRFRTNHDRHRTEG